MDSSSFLGTLCSIKGTDKFNRDIIESEIEINSKNIYEE
jgi:hypothetical protein